MELGLSLGDQTHKPFKLFGKSNEILVKKDDGLGLGFCMGLAPSVGDEMSSKRLVDTLTAVTHHHHQTKDSSSDSSVELHLLPFSPPHKPSHHQLPFPWLSHIQNCELNGPGLTRKHSVAVVEGGGTDSSSPDSSMMSSFRMEFGMYDRNKNKREAEHIINGNREMERYSNSRGGASDEEEMNGLLGNRKKLRLTKDQSAFLENSFKEHHTLNPKQKLGLAKQLNLRPRQVEVWFQNRRARTKLKQTEVDCEYLKRCCETLTQDNRRLQKELQELRALKSSQPFYMQLPATTLTMCPSCERVASTTTTAVTTVSAPATKPRLHPFLQDQTHALQTSS